MNQSFDLAISVGESGYDISKKINKKIACFNRINKLNIARYELSPLKYEVHSTSQKSILLQLEKLNSCSLALIDDTIYSGLTIETILTKLNSRTLKNTKVICLQGINKSLEKISNYCPVICGFKIEGEIEKDVTIIKTSGLFLNNAIRRKNRKPLAFYQRPEWINSWFPNNNLLIIRICQKLNELIEISDINYLPIFLQKSIRV